MEHRVGDPRFYRRAGPHQAAWLAGQVGATLHQPESGAPVPPLTGVAPLAAAGASEASFLDNRKYLDQLAATGAGLVVVSPAHAARRPAHAAALVTDDPYLAWARLAVLFHPSPAAVAGVHPTAIVEGDVDPSAEIGPRAYVGPRSSIGPRTRVGVGAVIEAGVVVGADCRIGTLASVGHAILGDRVVLLPGARVGQEGFGFANGPDGFVGVPQLGRVLIEDDVEVGANATVDRGSTGDTVIGRGSRLDNLVQIGHNVRLGRCCVVVAQAGISGSTTLEDFVTVAAQAGLTGHLRIGAKARIGAQAGVMSDVDPATDVVGSPAMGVREFFRNVATLRRLSRRG